MTIRQCDKCGKTISNKPIIVGLDIFYRVELCKNCAKPVIRFLNDNKLLVDELQKYGFKKPKQQVS